MRVSLRTSRSHVIECAVRDNATHMRTRSRLLMLLTAHKPNDMSSVVSKDRRGACVQAAVSARPLSVECLIRVVSCCCKCVLCGEAARLWRHVSNTSLSNQKDGWPDAKLQTAATTAPLPLLTAKTQVLSDAGN